MHEYGVVSGLLSQVDEYVRAHSGSRAVRVVLGLTGVPAPEARLLRDAFDTFKPGTSASQAELVLERAPLEACCLNCGQRVRAARGLCPRCGSESVLPAQAQEICLKSVEIEV